MKRNWMMMPVLALCAAAPLGAQQAAMASGSNTSLDALRPLYMQVKGYLTQSAEQMPEDEFSYRPTPEVRSFGEILGHVTNDQYYFCSAARNEDNPAPGDAEKLATKSEIMEALAASFAYCDELYSDMSAADLAAPSAAFGGRQNRLFPLIYNVSHDFEHYGNLITYFRLNGMVPPSSQGGGG